MPRCDYKGPLNEGDHCPSMARWRTPTGEAFCSLHFIHRFGHAERLRRIDDFEPPPGAKAKAAKLKKAPKRDDDVVLDTRR